MDYKDLANLIFPNSKEISYYEEKYPRRDLKEGAIVTRYAPSPTGFMHIGGLYQALIAKKVANQTEGVFFLRIEDTDQKREVENAVSGIVKSLQEFGIEPDEGMISEEEEPEEETEVQPGLSPLSTCTTWTLSHSHAASSSLRMMSELTTEP